jgi:hypothetical protein
VASLDRVRLFAARCAVTALAPLLTAPLRGDSSGAAGWVVIAAALAVFVLVTQRHAATRWPRIIAPIREWKQDEARVAAFASAVFGLLFLATLTYNVPFLRAALSVGLIGFAVYLFRRSRHLAPRR